MSSGAHGPPTSYPGVLLVCELRELATLSAALAQPASTGPLHVWTATDPTSALALFSEHRPEVVVVTATLGDADVGALIDGMRRMVGRAETSVVVVGDEGGAVTSALDAAELGGDRFVARPLSPKALRYAVAVSVDAARLARGSRGAAGPHDVLDAPSESHAFGAARASRRSSARLLRQPREGERQEQRARWTRLADSIVAGVNDGDDDGADEPTGETAAAPGKGRSGAEIAGDAVELGVAALSEEGGESEQAEPLPPVVIQPRQSRQSSPLEVGRDGGATADWSPPSVRSGSDERVGGPAPPSSSSRRSRPRLPGVAAVEEWSEKPTPPRPSRDSRRLLQPAASAKDAPSADEPVWSTPEILAQLDAATQDAASVEDSSSARQAPAGGGYARQLRQKMSEFAQRLFANQDPAQLEAAPRHDHQIEFDLAALVEEPAAAEPAAAEPLHAVRTGSGASARETQSGTVSTWDQGPREARQRQVPDAGEIVRGVCDAPAVVVRMWSSAATGRVVFRRGDVEKIVFFDRGRPVFASSTELHDRMGELLYREGKITHAQYMHSKSLVAESGRRMGEILVDLGYLKRRELYPAVRRHVEDIIYSVFAWDHGGYRVSFEEVASAERIRLARHPEALVVEGIRRKLDRSVLERLVGPPSTVLELGERERVLGVASAIELAPEERAAIAAIDGHADLPALARASGLSMSALYPLAWALIVLGHAHARRDGAELGEPGDDAVAPGEADLAIDRERVRARWQLVADADYFALLGVRRDATSFEIRRAYESSRRDFAAEGFSVELRRELARELDDIATVLDEAFRVLRDDPLRRQYLAHLVD